MVGGQYPISTAVLTHVALPDEPPLLLEFVPPVLVPPPELDATSDPLALLEVWVDANPVVVPAGSSVLGAPVSPAGSCADGEVAPHPHSAHAAATEAALRRLQLR